VGGKHPEWVEDEQDGEEIWKYLWPRCSASGCMAFRWWPDICLEITGGRIIMLDQEDAVLCEKSWWWDGQYAKGNDNEYLHRAIVQRVFGVIPADMFTDHIDGDPLNNRRGNLRIVTKAQNAANAAARGGASRYRGVFKARDKWASQIAKGGIRLCLGSFDTEEEAASAYDQAARQVHGEYARLNLEPCENSGRRGYCNLAGKPEER